MSNMKDALADVEQSLLEGVPADYLERWLLCRDHLGTRLESELDMEWWHEQRRLVVERYQVLANPALDYPGFDAVVHDPRPIKGIRQVSRRWDEIDMFQREQVNQFINTLASGGAA